MPPVPEREKPVAVKVKPSTRSLVRPKLADAPASASKPIRIVCGLEPDSADRYTLRNDALVSIARRCDLTREDVLSLMAYVAASNDTIKLERSAALKNDVLNLLRNQRPVPEGLAEMMIEMFESGEYEPVILDYCIQHLGGLQHSLEEGPLRERVRDTFERAAAMKSRSFAGTALYSMADDSLAGAERSAKLRRLAVSLATDEDANCAARIAAIQLAGERGYTESLGTLRRLIDSPHTETVLKIAAIGALGKLGGAGDLPRLERLRASAPERLVPALDSAIERLSKSKN